jgi:hypothetical protein
MSTNVDKVLEIVNEIEELKQRLYYRVSFGYRSIAERNPFIATKINELEDKLYELIKSMDFDEFKLLPQEVKRKLARKWIFWKSTCPMCNHELNWEEYEWGSFDHYDISIKGKCMRCGFEISDEWQEAR